MKKVIMCFTLLFSACQNTVDINLKQNKYCENIEEVEIFQTLDNYALAKICKNKDAIACLGPVVKIEEENIPLYDGKRITTPEDKCVIFFDTFQYETQKGTLKTVPILKFYNKYDTDEEILKKYNTDYLREFNQLCIKDLKQKNKKLSIKKIKQQCDCMSNIIKKERNEGATSHNEENFKEILKKTCPNFKTLFDL